MIFPPLLIELKRLNELNYYLIKKYNLDFEIGKIGLFQFLKIKKEDLK